MNKLKFASVVALFSLAATALTGCAQSPSSNAAPTASASSKVDAKAAALLPEKYKKTGLTAGSEIPYAPMEFFDENNQPIGFEVDLIAAVSEKLGVPIAFQEQSFDALIPALQSGKHDLAVSSMSDTVERQKVLDFVDYFNGGASLIVNKGNTDGVTGLASLCGKPVAAEAASWEVDVLASAAKDCVAAGKPEIVTKVFPSNVAAQSALRAGNVAAYLSDSQAAAYTAKVAGGGKYFDLVVDPANPNGYESGLIGVGILKANTGLRDAVAAALQSIFDDGTYQRLLTKWNLNSFAVASPSINGTK
ncbi:MAG: ABC transporter substrate-binding protein [Actinomycetales bacterium]|nr:ABC transporter substrate-binding protein [Actinomycetales bacterium]